MVRDESQSQISFDYDKMKKANEAVLWLNECQKKNLLIIGPNKLDVLFKLRKISASFHFIFLICCRKKRAWMCTKLFTQCVWEMLINLLPIWFFQWNFDCCAANSILQTNQRIRRAEKKHFGKKLICIVRADELM